MFKDREDKITMGWIKYIELDLDEEASPVQGDSSWGGDINWKWGWRGGF